MTMRNMTEAVLETIRQNHLRDGYIRLLVTRGIGNLGLNPTQCKSPSVIIIAATIALYHEDFYRKGLTIVTCATRRSNPAALNPAVKSLNYLNNVMARIEANLAGADEALMLNDAGNVAECTADNVFIVKHGQIFTPPVAAGALKGITRSVVFEIGAELGVKVRETDITRHDVFVADECFLTGTAAEIVPVVKADGRSIGNGKPGPITTRIIARFRQATRAPKRRVYKIPLGSRSRICCLASEQRKKLKKAHRPRNVPYAGLVRLTSKRLAALAAASAMSRSRRGWVHS